MSKTSKNSKTSKTSKTLRREKSKKRSNHHNSTINRKEFDTQTFFLIFLLSLVIFLIGIMVGYKVSEVKINQLSVLQEDLRTKTMNLELQFNLLSENPCLMVNSTPLTEELYELSSKVDYMETRLGQDNSDVQRLKDYYFTLEIRQMLLEQKTIQQCSSNDSIVLFFYARDNVCPDCKEQGFILTTIREVYPLVKVYSFDVDSNNDAVRTLVSLYNLDTTPAMVINGIVYKGFKKKILLESLILNETIVK